MGHGVFSNVMMILLVMALESVAATPDTTIPSNLAVDVEIRTSPTPFKADDNFHAVYELYLTNFSKHDLHLREIDVTDVSAQRVLARYEGQGLIDALSRPGTPADLPDKRVVGAGLSAVVFLDVIMGSRKEMRSVLSHRLVFEPIQGLTNADTTIEGVRAAVNPEPPIALAPPLRGSDWVASHAFSNTSEHRRSLVFVNGKPWIAQRFAVDWIRIGPNGQAFHDNPAKNENWAAYGANVLAVDNGRVVDLQDGIPENDPASEKKAVQINLETAGGNYIILDLGSGHFAFYAHLKPGSIKVRIGNRVKQGEMLALVGNSGNADAPHLHFQVMNANSPLAADGLPYVFRKFTVEGRLPSVGILADGKGWQRPSERAVLRENELPTENEVIDFGRE
jgi:murein DD-endopeptidase